jgi:hypothetical protein
MTGHIRVTGDDIHNVVAAIIEALDAADAHAGLALIALKVLLTDMESRASPEFRDTCRKIAAEACQLLDKNFAAGLN